MVESPQYEDEMPPPSYIQPSRPQESNVVYDKKPNQAIRWEVFDPDPGTIPMLARKYKLTLKRKYPILEEKTTIQRINLPGGGVTEMPGYEYLVIDDVGNKVRVPSMNFMPEQKGLIGMEEMMRAQQDYENAPKLMHMGSGNTEMPVLRR
jgi:hypothetical protein